MGQFCSKEDTPDETIKPGTLYRPDPFVPPPHQEEEPETRKEPTPPPSPSPVVIKWEPFNPYELEAPKDDNPKSELPTVDTIEAEKLGPPDEPNIHKMVLPNVDWKFYRIYQLQAMAYAAIKEVREGRGQTITNDDFKVITQFSSQYDENGRNMENKEDFFFLDKDKQIVNKDFDLMIRESVNMMLKYRGNFESLVSSDLFINEEQQTAKFYYQASHKVPFYFIYECSPHIQKELMAKYLENPINPMMFVTYDQQVKNLYELAPEDEKICRTIHLDLIYPKYKSWAPSLICIGNPGVGKSKFINSVFGVQFEVMQENSAMLFHDSVDAIFTSGDMPFGFNIMDFQGIISNKDHILIANLMKYIPQAYLLIQVSDDEYLPNVIDKIDEVERENFQERTMIICRKLGGKLTKVKKQIKNYFPSLKTDQIKNLTDMNVTAPTYIHLCKEVLVFFQELVKKNKAKEEEDITEIKLELQIHHGNEVSEHEYTQIYGYYWLLVDSMMRLEEEPGFEIHNLSQEYRQEYMKVKNFLFNHTKEEMENLSREKIFPIYTTALKVNEIDKKLRKREMLSIAQNNQFEKDKKELKSKKPVHGLVFKTYIDALMTGKKDLVNMVLELVEAHYTPRCKDQKEKIKKLKLPLEENEKLISELEAVPDQLKPSATPAEIQKYTELKEQRREITGQVNEITQQLESIVLDSELFLREAKQMFCMEDKRDSNQHKVFKEVISEMFENGYAMEVIDGDIDKIEQNSFEAVLEWVHQKKQNNSKLLVVTILGPQSSGKSTLLNYLVGAKFHVSAGRCTKGLNAMLLRSNFEETKEMLILDSEGIFSIERNDPMYDRRLAIFCLAVSNVLLINIKGELTIQIQKVLQVAIYALQKISSVQALVRKAKIHFILRDQVDHSTVSMEAAFEKLKDSLRQAAQAAGAPNLDQLIDIPETADEIITMFASALEIKLINENRTLQHTRSSDIFREQCAKLRSRILNIARTLDPQSRISSMMKWGKDSIAVLSAVMDNDDLVGIEDLQQINDNRQMVVAIEDFRVIMSKAAPDLEEGQSYGFLQNPFLTGQVAEALRDEQTIREDKTFFAILTAQIQIALDEQEIQERGNSGQRLSGADRFQEKMKEKFETEVEKFVQKYIEHVIVFTERFDPELTRTAKNSVKQVIKQIQQKAMVKWTEKQASSSIDSSLRKMVNLLKDKVYASRLQNAQFSKEDFIAVVQTKKDETKENIKQRFFRTHELVLEDVIQEFKLTELRLNKAEEVKSESQVGEAADSIQQSYRILSTQAKCLQNNQIIHTNFEQPLDQLTDEAILRYASRDDDRVRDSILRYIENSDPKYKKFKLPLQKQIDELKKGAVEQTFSGDETQTKMNEIQEKFNAMKAELKEKYIPVVDKIIKTNIKKYLNDLHVKINQVLNEITEINLTQQKVQQVPRATVNKLFDVFQEELKRQNDQRTQTTAKNVSLQSMGSMITYEQINYLADFNTIYFNILLNQEKRNYDLTFKEIDDKIEHAASEQIEKYDQYNQNVSSADESADGFVVLVIEQLIEVLQKELLSQYETKMDSIDTVFNKEDNMKEAFKAFKEAEDSETIIQHMQDPVELERRVFKNKFIKTTHTYAGQISDLFDQNWEQGLQNCQEFITSLNDTLRGRTQKGGISDGAKADFIQFMFGSLMKDVADAECVGPFLAKKDEAERHRLFQEAISLPNFHLPIFQLQATRNKFEGEQFTNQNVQLISPLAKAVSDIPTFVSFIDFNKKDNEQINRIITTARSKFLSDLEAKRKQMNNFEFTQEIVIGCRAKCPFCGARCMEREDCKQNNQRHKALFHRPMAFRGTNYQDKDGNTVLFQDVCTSDQILHKSRWPKGDQSLTEDQQLLKGMNQEQISTEGLNIIMTWRTGSDLDIQIKCGCDKWHGNSTEGGSGGDCLCETCGMKRTSDQGPGDDASRRDANDPAKETVNFSDPSQIIGKTIEFAVVNSLQNSAIVQNQFDLKIMNAHGEKLFPEGDEREPWMVCTNETGNKSEVKSYTVVQADIDKGINGMSNSFEDHAKFISKQLDDQQWDFKQNDGQQRIENTDVNNEKEVRNEKYQEKWQIVKDLLCGPDYFECLDLEHVLNPNNVV